MLGFDYEGKIEQFLQRENHLHDQLEERASQISQLKDMVFSYRKLIETLSTHLHDSKTLKELQWKNIIEYDQIKNKQKLKMNKTIKSEVEDSREIVKSLYATISQKESQLAQSQ